MSRTKTDSIKMKILQVIPFFSPKTGGMVPAVSNLSNLLVSRGHEVSILTTDYLKDSLQEVDESISVVIHKNIFVGYKFFLSPGMNSWLRKNLKDYDIVHMHGFRAYQNILTSRWSLRVNVPYVLTPHGTTWIKDRLFLVKRIYDILFGNRVIRNASRIYAVCPPEVREIEKKKVDKGKIDLLYPGLNIEEFENFPNKGAFKIQFGIPRNTKVVLGLGRIHRVKGFDVLIKSFALILENREDIQLAIVGPDEGHLEELQLLVSELKIADKVIFTGPLYGEEKLAAYHDADVFVMNSYFEAFGTVSFEALLASTPLIIADEAGMSEVIEEYKAGFVTPYGDVPALAKLISRVLDGGEEIEQSVQAGKKLVRENFSWEVIADKLEREYESLVTK